MFWRNCRDFVGYGADLPNPEMSNGARLAAVNFVMN